VPACLASSVMTRGARTPEELDTLFEDAWICRDASALAGLFEDGGVLVDHVGFPPGGRRGGIAGTAARLWSRDRLYVAGPARVLQAGDLALGLGSGVGVARCRDGAWQYAIKVLDEEEYR
jgi:hypothetical protein